MSITRIRPGSGGLPLVIAGASLWGTDAALRAPLAAAFPPAAVVLAQYLLLALFAVPVVVRGRRSFARLPLRGWLALAGIAWGSAGLGAVLLTTAYQHGNPTTAALLLNAQPLFAAALALPLLRERPPVRYWPCAAAALVGAYLLAFGTLPPSAALAGGLGLAALCALGAAFLFGSATVFGRAVLDKLSPTELAAARYLGALPVLAALALAQGGPGATATALTGHLLRLAVVSLMMLAGMLLYYRGLGRTGAAEATLGELACPAVALILNRAFLGVSIAPAQFAGFAVLWLAITALTCLPAARARLSTRVLQRPRAVIVPAEAV